MFALMYLGTAAVLVAAAIWAGLAAYRSTQRRWVQIVVSTVVLGLPFWDLLPGLYFYNKAIREVGGVRIHRQVRAAGYLDLSCAPLCRGAYATLVNSPYSFVEIRMETPDPVPHSLTQQVGYYELRLFKVDSERCLTADLPVDVTRYFPNEAYGLRDVCVVARRRDKAISRYRHESSHGWRRSEAYSWLRSVNIRSDQIVDGANDEIIAEASNISYRPWFFLLSLTPWVWNYYDPPTDQHFSVDRIIVPAESQGADNA